MKNNLLEAYQGFKSGFMFEATVKNKILKLFFIVMFGPTYISLFLTMLILLIFNHWTNRLMKISVDILIYVFKKYEGKKKLILLLFLGVILGPFVFALYVLVLVYRVLIRIFVLLYNIVFFTITLLNREITESGMDKCVKVNQENDIF